MPINQGVWLCMLSTVSVFTGRIFYDAEAKLTSLIGMTIFNNGIQFRTGEEETCMAMISAVRNVSRYHKVTGMKIVRGLFIHNFLIIISRTNLKGYQTGQTYMDFIFKVMVQHSSTRPSLIYLPGGGVNYLWQSKILWNVQVTSQVVTRRMINVLCRFSLLQLMTLIQRRTLCT